MSVPSWEDFVLWASRHFSGKVSSIGYAARFVRTNGEARVALATAACVSDEWFASLVEEYTGLHGAPAEPPNVLLEMATELEERAPLPKPERVESGQAWRYSPSVIVTGDESIMDDEPVFRVREREFVRGKRLLNDPRWIYLGRG